MTGGRELRSRAASDDRAVRDLVTRCHVGLDALSLQSELVERLGRILHLDAFFCASVDPATLLFTGAVLREIPPESTPRFLANEFLEDDVNKFRTLAGRRFPVDWLDRATGDRRAASPRYREIMAPLGLGDELRAAFRSGGECWGFLCGASRGCSARVHRGPSSTTSASEPRGTDGESLL